MPLALPRLLGVPEQAAHLLQGPSTPTPAGGQPAPPFMCGGFPPQKANTYNIRNIPEIL